MSEPVDLWTGSEGDSVAAVSPADLRAVWQLFRDAQAGNPGQHMSIGNSVYQNVCSPGADAVAAWYRAGMLWMLKMFPESPLVRWIHDGEYEDAVFEVAATFPMKKMDTGVVYDGPPFDMEEFVKQVGART